jgi:hypothetical protein
VYRSENVTKSRTHLGNFIYEDDVANNAGVSCLRSMLKERWGKDDAMEG